MDTQCDKCGRQLPTYDVSEPEGQVQSCHISVGQAVFDPDGRLVDSGSGYEYDLCDKCSREFLQLWERWYIWRRC